MTSRDLSSAYRERRNAKVALRQLEQWTEENVVDGLLTAPEYEATDVERGKSQMAEPSWVRAYREVEISCEKAECDLRRLVQAQRKRSLVTFDQREEMSLDRDLSDAAETARAHLRTAERILKTSLHPRPGDSDATLRCKANAKKKLASKVAQLTKRFRFSKKVSKSHDDGLQDLDFLTSGAEKRALDMLESRRPGDVIVTLEQAAALEADAKFLDDRDNEITKVAKSVDDIAHIFKELAVLVIDQGTILDRVDFNMEMVAEQTRRATGQLIHANRSDADARPLKTVIFLLVLISILSFILFLKLAYR